MRTLERDGPLTVTVSIGLVAWPDDGATLDQLMNAVDEAMYASKRRGKNRIVGPYAGAAGRPPATPAASLAGGRRASIPIPERVGRAG
jgi:hypothetical protein